MWRQLNPILYPDLTKIDWGEKLLERQDGLFPNF